MVFASANFGLSWILEIVALVPIVYIVWKYVWAVPAGFRAQADGRRGRPRSGRS